MNQLKGLVRRMATNYPGRSGSNPSKAPRTANKRPNVPPPDRNADVMAAFDAGDANRGFQLLDEHLGHDKMPQTDVWLSYLDYCQNHAGKLKDNLHRMLTYVETSGILLTKQTVDVLKILLEQYDVPMSDNRFDGRYIFLWSSQSEAYEVIYSSHPQSDL